MKRETTIIKSANVTMQGRTVIFEVREYEVDGSVCGTIWYAGDKTGEHKRQMSFATVDKAIAQYGQMMDQIRKAGGVVEEL